MKFILIFVILLSTLKVYSQEIQASVSVDVQQVNQEFRINVQSMASDLEKYINNTKFTNGQWEGPKIPVDISIILSGGFNNSFQGRLILTSQLRLNNGGTGAQVSPILFHIFAVHTRVLKSTDMGATIDF